MRFTERCWPTPSLASLPLLPARSTRDRIISALHVHVASSTSIARSDVAVHVVFSHLMISLNVVFQSEHSRSSSGISFEKRRRKSFMG